MDITIPELIGSDVSLVVLYPTIADSLTQPLIVPISQTEVEFDAPEFLMAGGDPVSLPMIQFDIRAGIIDFQSVGGYSGDFTDVDFNGFAMSFAALWNEPQVQLANVTILDGSNSIGLPAGDLSFSTDTIYMDFGGLIYESGDTFALSLGFEAFGTPEADRFFGSSAADIFNGGGLDDQFFASDGADTFNGGDGFDLVDYSDAEGRVLVDLQSDVSGRTYAQFFDEGASQWHIYNSIEDARGGGFADDIRGNSESNFLYGGGFSDRLYGRAGDDHLWGESGADAFYGNLGADTMFAGTDEGRRDRFIYYSIADTGVGAGNRDLIYEFVSGEDRIEIGRIDADTTQGRNQAFTFVGSAGLSGAAGELAAVFDSETYSTIVMGDVDGDGLADFEIALWGVFSLTAEDFLL